MEWEGAGAVGGAEMAVPLPLPLASESQQPYVSELLSFTLDRLHKEPELLRVDAERIRHQMQEVAVSNYRSFIAAADALLAIRQEVSSIDNHLESMKYPHGRKEAAQKERRQAKEDQLKESQFKSSTGETLIQAERHFKQGWLSRQG